MFHSSEICCGNFAADSQDLICSITSTCSTLQSTQVQAPPESAPEMDDFSQRAVKVAASFNKPSVEDLTKDDIKGCLLGAASPVIAGADKAFQVDEVSR